VIATIDVHAHLYPGDLPDFGGRTGDLRWPALVRGVDTKIVQGRGTFRVIDSSYYDTGVRLERMNRLGIDRQVLSPLPVLLPYWADNKWAAEWCRAVNDSVARTVDASDRFLGMGIVPLQDPAAAIVEVQRLAEAGFVGVELGTALDDRRLLSDPAADDVLVAIGEADLRVLVHPNRPGVLGPAGGSVEGSLGLLTDSAVAIGSLLLRQDAPARYPDVCVAHGGGTLLWAWQQIVRRLGRPLELPEWLYVDTAGCTPAHVAFVAEVIGFDGVLFGSDLPATKDQRVRALVERLVVDYPGVLETNPRTFMGVHARGLKEALQ
jgi:aminocarboxymuconate-semialdehyde decarboxylase